MKTVIDYTDEELLSRWREERELLLDLGDLLSSRIRPPRHQRELEEDHERHSQYIARIRAEMAARGMFADDGSLKAEYKDK